MNEIFHRHLQVGRQLFAVGSYERAAQEFESALGIEPEDHGARLQLARCWIHLDRLEKAHAETEIALRYAPNSADAHYVASFTTHKWKLALASIDAAIALAPQKSTYYERRCFILTRLTRYSLAIESGRRALELDPNLASNHRQMADTLFDESGPRGLFATTWGLSREKYEQASFHVARALELEPDNARSHSLQARLKSFDLEHEASLHGWEESLRLNPNEKYAQFQRRRAKEQLRKAQFQEMCWRVVYSWMPWPLRLPINWAIMLAGFWWGVVQQPKAGPFSGFPFLFLFTFVFGSIQTPLLLRDWLRFIPDRYLGGWLRPFKKPPLR